MEEKKGWGVYLDEVVREVNCEQTDPLLHP